MTISEKIFELIKVKGINQKKFSQATGIAQSSISDWKRKKTNPSADKILIISEVLGVSPYDLLSGTDTVNNKSNPSEVIMVRKESELGNFLMEFQSLDANRQGRVMGYVKALKEME